MTDPNTAQAALLVEALRAELEALIPKLTQAQRDVARSAGFARHARRRRALDHLRRDVHQVQFLITRLYRRFPDLDSAGLAAGDI